MASNNPMGEIFSGSGLVFLGGLIGAVISVTIILNQNKVSWLKFADLLGPLIFLGYAIGRIGCFLVGDDYGIPSKLPWAISFPNGLPPTTTSYFTSQYPWIDISDYPVGIRTRILTSLSYGLPCIAHISSSLGLHRLKHGENILFCHDTLSFVECVENLMHIKGLPEKIGKNSRDLWLKNYNPLINVDQILKIVNC